MTALRVLETSLPGVLVVEPRVFRDERGFFLELFHESHFAECGLPTQFVQDNRSRSTRSVLRGLHYQLHTPQGKLVAVTAGAILDVAVDIRIGSPTFGRWASVTLTGDDPRCLWIPHGFAHGFCVLSEQADVLYKCTAPYDPAGERGIAWNDPDLAIAWPIASPIQSPRDAALPTLKHALHDLPRAVP